jgi:hypothetical protein
MTNYQLTKLAEAKQARTRLLEQFSVSEVMAPSELREALEGDLEMLDAKITRIEQLAF